MDKPLRAFARHYAAGTNVAARLNPAPKIVEDAHTQRELFVDILTANATRRDAKQYLSRFQPPKPLQPPPSISKAQEELNTRHRLNQKRVDRMGVNLGGLYAPIRSIADAPQFSRDESNQDSALALNNETHVALVSLRSPEGLDESTLDGLAITLSQLIKLGMRLLIILGHEDVSVQGNMRSVKASSMEQAERLIRAIERHSPGGARFVADALEVADEVQPRDSPQDCTVAAIASKLVFEPLGRGVVTIMPTLAYTPTGRLTQISMKDAMTALAAEISNAPQYPFSLDRIILLEPFGGIPSRDRNDGAHIFINLKQELDDIKAELNHGGDIAESSLTKTAYSQHLENLEITQMCLASLPSASSALIVTPEEAASSSQKRNESEPIGAGTRAQKNTLIHNLLTNKPMVSSSLPLARLSSSFTTDSETCTSIMPATTLVKKGMPLTIIPAVGRQIGWQVPSSGRTPLRLEDDPRIDFHRLLHLIENSFRRKLDVQHYLNRVSSRLAGLIIAGDYEGGAILTWEPAPGAPPDDPSRLVPYLDKFAVLQTSQGSAGVADIVFQAMVRSCFPHGVCWRSRKDNPVNKWYFERAAGTWQIPDSNWTLFWTGEGVVDHETRLMDYVGVCRQVAPSWADNKKPD